jgi:hypothetical protein
VTPAELRAREFVMFAVCGIEPAPIRYIRIVEAVIHAAILDDRRETAIDVQTHWTDRSTTSVQTRIVERHEPPGV